ncbi:MAG: preprotein translocase subunit SecG [bacterium]
MEIFFLSIHFLIALLLIVGILIQASKSEGLGALGGGGDNLFRGGSAKGFEAFVEQTLKYVAWGFLITSFFSAIFLPRMF